MKRPLFLLFCLTCLGILLLYPRSYVEDPYFPQGDSYSVQVTGTVYSYEKKATSFSLLLCDCRITWEDQQYRCDRILVYTENDPQVRPGNQLSLTGTLSSFQPARNPGNMDWWLYYRSQHISYRLYARELTVTDPHIFWLRDRLLTLRDHWMAQLDRMEVCWQDRFPTLFSSGELSPMLAALLLGNQSALSEETYSLYETAGILPVLSISGLHISLIGGGILLFCRKLRLPPWCCRLAASVLVLGYWQLCGGKVSAGRAALLFLSLNLAPLLHRSYDPLSALSLTGILFLLGSPLLLFQTSFLLSFGAMFGICLICPVLQPAAQKQSPRLPAHPATRYLVKTLSFSAGLQLALFPLTLYLFFRYPAYTIFANLLLLPLTTPLLFCGILGLLLSECSLALGAWLLLPCRIILWIYDKVCRLIALLPGASILLGRPSPVRMALYYLLLFFLVLTWKRLGRLHEISRSGISSSPGRHTATAAAVPFLFPLRHCPADTACPILSRLPVLRFCAVLLLLALLPSLLLPLPGRALQVTFVDVGQGDCALIRSPSGTAILIDGGSSDLSGVTEDRLIPFLESQGIGQLDYVFLSHTDQDHVNAVTGWLEAGYPIGAVILPRLNESLSAQTSYLAIQDTCRLYQVPLLYFDTGDLWQEDDLSLLCLGPQPADSPAGRSYTSLNAASLVLLMEYQDIRILFTGDCSDEGETLLVQELAHRGLTCQILKAGHHGSRTATGEALLRQLRPSLCIISCGIHNIYHHPSQETTTRLTAAGIPYYVTADSGAVQLQIQKGRLTLKTMLP